MTKNLTDVAQLCMWLSMGRKLHIQIKFTPTRISDELLHSAYELVLPLMSRIVVDREPWDREDEYEDEDSCSKQNIKAEDRQ